MLQRCRVAGVWRYRGPDMVLVLLQLQLVALACRNKLEWLHLQKSSGGTTTVALSWVVVVELQGCWWG